MLYKLLSGTSVQKCPNTIEIQAGCPPQDLHAGARVDKNRVLHKTNNSHGIISNLLPRVRRKHIFNCLSIYGALREAIADHIARVDPVQVS